MNLILSGVLAFPLVCLALLTLLALLGLLTLAAALRGVGAIRASVVGKGRRGMVDDSGRIRGADPLDY